MFSDATTFWYGHNVQQKTEYYCTHTHTHAHTHTHTQTQTQMHAHTYTHTHTQTHTHTHTHTHTQTCTMNISFTNLCNYMRCDKFIFLHNYYNLLLHKRLINFVYEMLLKYGGIHFVVFFTTNQ